MAEMVVLSICPGVYAVSSEQAAQSQPLSHTNQIFFARRTKNEHKFESSGAHAVFVEVTGP
jgi:hypothetical protein